MPKLPSAPCRERVDRLASRQAEQDARGRQQHRQDISQTTRGPAKQPGTRRQKRRNHAAAQQPWQPGRRHHRLVLRRPQALTIEPQVRQADHRHQHRVGPVARGLAVDRVGLVPQAIKVPPVEQNHQKADAADADPGRLRQTKPTFAVRRQTCLRVRRFGKRLLGKRGRRHVSRGPMVRPCVARYICHTSNVGKLQWSHIPARQWARLIGPDRRHSPGDQPTTSLRTSHSPTGQSDGRRGRQVRAMPRLRRRQASNQPRLAG